MWSKVTKTSKNFKDSVRIQNDINPEITNLKSGRDKWRLLSDKVSLGGSAAEL